MPTQIIKFDGVDLSDYFSSWQESANSRINAVTVPRRHGALVTDSIVEEPRVIAVSGRIQAATAEALRTLLDTLSELFTRRNKQLQLWDDRYIIANKSQFGISYVHGSAMRAVDFSLQFFCADPFWYGTTPSSENYDLSTSDIPLDITNNIYRRVVSVTNGGNQYIFPVITVTPGGTPLTTVIVRNMTTGRYFIYSGTVAVGTSLVIDMANFTVENNGIEDLTNFQGDFFSMQPGANTIHIEGTAPANYKFDYTKRYS